MRYGTCFLCGKTGWLEEHHVYPGPFRDKSEKYGLKVSSLYISQVKRKCGLDVGQNYNLSKKEDAKVPQCPPEKEAAIMEALKYFQMIH